MISSSAFLRLVPVVLAALQLVTAVPSPPRVLAQRATPSALTGFCKAYASSCHTVCLSGQTGAVKVVYLCEQPASGSFNFGCTCDGVEQTSEALAQASDGKSPSSTKTVTFKKTTTKVVGQTKSLTKVQTVQGQAFSTFTESDVITLPVSTLTTYSTSTAEDAPAVTLTSTISGTLTETPYKVIVETDTQTSIVSSSTTSYGLDIGTGAPPAPAAASRRELVDVDVQKRRFGSKRATSSFCSAYADSCTRTCSAAKSSVSDEVCKLKTNGKKSDTYSLSCVCKKNSKTSTLDALAGIDDYAQPVPTKSLTLTSTAFSTSVITRTASSTTILDPSSTGLTTLKLLSTVQPSTTEFEELVTTLSPTPTSYQTVNNAVSTKTARKVTTTSTASVTVTQSAVSTTVIALAATGRIRFNNPSDGSFRGYYGGLSTYPDGDNNGQTHVVVQDVESAVQVGLAVVDPNVTRSGTIQPATPGHDTYGIYIVDQPDRWLAAYNPILPVKKSGRCIFQAVDSDEVNDSFGILNFFEPQPAQQNIDDPSGFQVPLFARYNVSGYNQVLEFGIRTLQYDSGATRDQWNVNQIVSPNCTLSPKTNVYLETELDPSA